MDHAADAFRTDLMTITRFVLNEQSKHPESRGDFTILLSHIVLGCKFVCSAVNKVISVFEFDSNSSLFIILIFFHLRTVVVSVRVRDFIKSASDFLS